MHQTFYIDAEEEISSVIDRLNKSVSLDNYFVVPKRAIFLQSIVNLKLLKREAEKTGKRLIIVTQDEIGSSMAERCGLSVKPTMEGLDAFESEGPSDVGLEIDEDGDSDLETEVDGYNEEKKNRLNMVGSSDFYDANEDVKSSAPAAKMSKSKSRKIPIRSSSDIKVNKKVKENYFSDCQEKATEGISQNGRNFAKNIYENNIDPGKEKTLERMYSSVKPFKKGTSSAPVSETVAISKKTFMIFVALGFFIFVGVAIYLFLPSANIIITPNVTNEKVDVTINGNTDFSTVDQKNMPVRFIDKEEKISLSNEVSSSGSGVGKKAHGTVVLYNEYNNSPQTLIATTRIEFEGKIFRLVKSVVVPGMTVGSETKAGVIEAEVVADQPGEDFNLAPASFKIPGFKDSPKYEKFYAKSTEGFSGGSSEGGNVSNSITQRDIDNAKQKTEVVLKEKIMKAVSDELREGEIALTQAEKITITKGGTSAKVGDASSSFDYEATAQIRAIVFLEKDVKEIIQQMIKDKDSKDSRWEISKIEYGSTTADFEKNTLELKVHADILVNPNIDLEKIKKELLGKKDDQLSSILKNYSSIKNVNVEFQPTIVSRIPEYDQRVSIRIQND